MCPHLLERSDVDGGSAIGHEALGEAHASERQADGLLYTDEIPDGRGIILQYRIQNGEFVYSPQSTTTEDKTEEEEVTYQ